MMQPPSVGKQRDAVASDWPRSCPTTDNQWCDERIDLVDQIIVEKRTDECTATFNEHPVDAYVAEVTEQSAQVNTAIRPRHYDNICSSRCKRLSPLDWSLIGAGNDSPSRQIGRKECGRGRSTRESVNDDTKRMVWPAQPGMLSRYARCQQGIIGKDGTNADHDRVMLVAELMRKQPRRSAGDPSTVASSGSNTPVKRYSVLDGHLGHTRLQPFQIASVDFNRPPLLKPNGNGNTSLPQLSKTSPIDRRKRITERSDDARNTSRKQRFGTGRSTAVVGARFQCHVERSTTSLFASLA